MKIDAMTAGAVGFAAFAAWYVLKKPAAKSGASGGQIAVDTAIAQRQAVGNALSQNTDYLYSLFGIDTPKSLPSMGGAGGLQL